MGDASGISRYIVKLFLLNYGLAIFIGGAFTGPSAMAQDTLHVWMRAFIDVSNPVAIPSSLEPRRTMIPAPMNSEYCFATDNRTFSNDPNASARMSSKFMIVIRSRDVATVQPAPDSDAIHTPGSSKLMRCADGQVVESRQGVVKQSNLGGPHSADGVTELYVEVAASNPFAEEIAGSFSFAVPDINYRIRLIYNQITHKLKVSGLVDRFPSFEMYARVNSRSTVNLLRLRPSGVFHDPLDLYDLGAGRGYSVNEEASL